MKEIFAYIVGGLLVLLLMLGLGWVIQGNDFFMFQYFAPKVAQVQYDTFKQSQSYNDGTCNDLQNLELQYVQADDGHKKAIANIILQRTASYDLNKLPPALRGFVEQLKTQEGLN